MSNKLNHIAFICDGNGRWATQQGLPRSAGHEAGLHKIEDICYWCRDLNIHIATFYVFSLDNWKRPKEEVDILLHLANKYFDRYQEFVDENIRVLVSGCLDGASDETIKKLTTLQEKTQNCTGSIVHLCANYSGKREIVDAIAKGARTEEEITNHLYQNLPFPDVIVRTGGHHRLSDFLTWQSTYSELYFSDTLFPDFSFGELKYIYNLFGKETRKFGGLI